MGPWNGCAARRHRDGHHHQGDELALHADLGAGSPSGKRSATAPAPASTACRLAHRGLAERNAAADE